MRFDRHIIDFVQWLHELIWSREHRHKRQVIEKIGASTRTPHGYVQQIKRFMPEGVPDRDVSAWMFMPFRHDTRRAHVLDYYIVCLFLGTVGGDRPVVNRPRKRRRTLEPTHRVIVGQSSHWVDSWQQFDTNILFEGDYDFQDDSPHPHDNAITIMRHLVQVLHDIPIGQIDWDYEIQTLRKLRKLKQL